MCGIAGVYSFSKTKTPSPDIIEGMLDTISHRGPDGGGVWSDPETPALTLGHRRLAIIDLSAEGYQPMASASGRYMLSYNGEIYNFQILRAELEAQGHVFRGYSDTEVLLAVIEARGFEKALTLLNGMFAIALWDRQSKTLTLARDRLGKKPLYYGLMNGHFMFASELKSLRAHPDFVAEIDRNALAGFMRYMYVPAPLSIYKGISKLPPASYLQIDLSGPPLTALPTPSLYWDFAGIAEAAPHDISREDAKEQLDTLLTDAVGVRMISDVPLGSFLSGGIDSSVVTALAQKNSSSPVKTFSIGFKESLYDESKYAAKVAEHLGTEHTSLILSAEDSMKLIPEMPQMFDEPFADHSQIPTYQVAQMAKRDVTVALSGDGGDELFCGYHRYNQAHQISAALFWCPSILRKFGASVLGKIPLPNKYKKMAEMGGMKDETALFARMLSFWTSPEALVLGASEPQTIVNTAELQPRIDDIRGRGMAIDTMSYLPDDILVKVDRTSMATSLEARAPLLDYRVVEFAWSLPMGLKTARGGKGILKDVLGQYVPDELFERPKWGFSLPLGEWLREDLRDWAENLLDEKRLRAQGYLNADMVRGAWQAHLAGDKNQVPKIWAVLMFQAWLDRWMSDAH